ncbi:cyclic peptide export ABC transporter [Vibrio mangrovi]|uniref:ABC transporter ATP-binding protein YojI n=1 Tax=Vibrio mangrovi TaxID=474394 RepID=A0A1Y6J2F5_9VIBR|nr:cyclic peptide export ABC transporter [Vibrio mangrovi]MDW6005257.1 cyclic peptide export ABC transporter [Vibrio mangrovi]SMS02882.1 ABC transporter ATP-binding protein YojI [Vibrio mangrovi]
MFKSILSRFKWSILSATFLSVIGALAGILMLKIMTTQVSLIGAGKSPGPHAFLIFVGAVFVVLLFSLTSRYLLAKLSARIVYEFRDALAKRLLSTSYAMLEKIGGHRVMAAMKTDVTKLSDGLLILPGFMYSLVSVLLCLGYMMYTSWQLFVVVFILISAIIIIAKFFLKIGFRHYTLLREYEDEMFSGLRTLVDGIKELSINANRRRFTYNQILEPNFKAIRQRSIKVSVIFTMLGSMASTLVFFVIGVIVFGSRVYFPDVPLEVVVTFVLTILYMVNPLQSVVDSINRFSDCSASYRKIEELALADLDDFERTTEGESESSAACDSWQTLSVENLQFQYQPDSDDEYTFHVGPVHAAFRRGEAIFLTGGNGSGKSTFAKLLVGLYQPSQGTIRLDEQVVSDTIELHEYQQMFSTIFSDFHLFEHVLNEAGEPESDAVIEKYLLDLELGSKVTSKDGKLSSVAMSQGQKKRLALLMSYIENTPVCLYDEWAADQDPRFREIFYTRIIPELKRQNKLVIVISHDDRYFHLADQLIQFENGKIVDHSVSGKPENTPGQGIDHRWITVSI